MKILNILFEAQFSKPIYAYHATEAKNLASILKHGMVPNHSEGGYGSDGSSPSVGYSLAPQSGVYFTRSAKAAMYIAKSINADTVVIVCKVQERDADMDEDRMVSAVLDEKIFMQQLRQRFRNVSQEDEAFETNLVKFIDKYTATIFTDILPTMNDKWVEYVTPSIKEYLTAVANYYFDVEFEGREDDSDLKEKQGILTKKLRRLVTINKDDNHTFKIDKPITFSGANKIVGAFDINTNLGWGDIGDLTGWAYHIVNSPLKILDTR